MVTSRYNLVAAVFGILDGVRHRLHSLNEKVVLFTVDTGFDSLAEGRPSPSNLNLWAEARGPREPKNFSKSPLADIC